MEQSLWIVLWQSSIGLLDFRCYLHVPSWSLPITSDVGRFAYKSIRIQVDSHTSRSSRRHDLGRFAYIEVVSPKIRIADMKSIRIRNLSRFSYKKSLSPTYLSSKLFCVQRTSRNTGFFVPTSFRTTHFRTTQIHVRTTSYTCSYYINIHSKQHRFRVSDRDFRCIAWFWFGGGSGII